MVIVTTRSLAPDADAPGPRTVTQLDAPKEGLSLVPAWHSDGISTAVRRKNAGAGEHQCCPCACVPRGGKARAPRRGGGVRREGASRTGCWRCRLAGNRAAARAAVAHGNSSEQLARAPRGVGARKAPGGGAWPEVGPASSGVSPPQAAVWPRRAPVCPVSAATGAHVAVCCAEPALSACPAARSGRTIASHPLGGFRLKHTL